MLVFGRPKKQLPAPLQRGAGAHGVLWLSSPGAGGSPGDYLSRGFMVGTKADIIYLMCCDIILFTIAAIFVLLGSLASLRIISNLIAITV